MVYRKLVCFKLFKHCPCFTALNLGCFYSFKMPLSTFRSDPCGMLKAYLHMDRCLTCALIFFFSWLQVQPHQTDQEKIKCLCFGILQVNSVSREEHGPFKTLFSVLLLLYKCLRSSLIAPLTASNVRKQSCSEFFSKFLIVTNKKYTIQNIKNSSVVQENLLKASILSSWNELSKCVPWFQQN